ncbi:MAG: right-handed parallel beta-helix repeat-containing protein [Chitinispirillaceae bacterium]|nr:right-handed parallel beta-helix repeat-containing protein [Chitinispirillaceae bacterium]
MFRPFRVKNPGINLSENISPPLEQLKARSPAHRTILSKYRLSRSLAAVLIMAAGSAVPVRSDTAVATAPDEGGLLLPDSLVQEIKTVIPPGIFFGTFDREDGPYLIDGSVTVPSGQVLEFKAGSVVHIGGDYSTITVFGQIIARGTPEEPVIFMSARKRPNPWDWDRIYCRSRNQSLFEHCIIRHSNFGITVENGSVTINRCLFERNSLYGLAVKNAEVNILFSTFSKGHVLGMLLNAGADVTGDSLVIKDNTTGIGCDGKARLLLSRSVVEGNVNGIVATPDASVSLVGSSVSRNRTGIITQEPVPKKNRDMVFNNGLDEKIVDAKVLRGFLKEPETVRSIALPITEAATGAKEGFNPGFNAVSAEDRQAPSFIGTVTTGFRFFQPEPFRHPLSDTVFSQTLYPTDLQPEIQVFANGKRGNTDVNLLMDLYSNSWLNTEGYFGKNMLNLGLSYDNHTLSFGDFFESGSETSVSGRQMTGIKYTGYYWDMGGGMRRMEYRLAAGESEMPRDSGRHDLRQYNITVDSGMSMRQQLTYVMATTLRPSPNSTFSAQGIIARDQVDKPLFRHVLSDPGAPRPIEAQTGVLAGTLSLLKGSVELSAEVDLGTHDTINAAEEKNIAWYNPELEDALPKIFRNFLSASDFGDHYAVTLGGKGFYRDYTVNFAAIGIGPEYFSAGNPYLESNRRIARCAVERLFSEYRSFGAGYEYEQTLSTGTPIDRNNLNMKMEYGCGENRPAFSLNYLVRLETATAGERFFIVTPDTEDDDSTAYGSYRYEKLTNSAALEGKQNLSGAVSYSAGYQFLWDNDLSVHVNSGNNDIGDRFQHQVTGMLMFRINKTVRNKTNFRVTLKDENRDSLATLAYKVSDQVGLTLIPRRLTMSISAEISRKTEEKFAMDTLRFVKIGWQDPVLTSFYGGDIEVKYSLSSRLTFTAKGRYEKSYDEMESSRENYLLKMAGMHMTWLF